MRWYARLYLLLTAIAALISVPAHAAPTNPHGDINFDCSTCHSVDSWTDVAKASKFPHDKTRFSLNGAHKQVKCASCHQDLTFEKTPEQCMDCHMDIHQGELGDNCQSCHSTSSWDDQQDILSLHAQRGFPLTGVHAAADCQSCHQNQLREEFAGTSQECQGCHYDTFVETDDPDHMKAAFSVDCQVCHGSRPTGWAPADWEHPPTAILQQAHLGLQCMDCHSQQYAGTTEDCYSCHSEDFETAEDPDHVAAGFPQECNTCHSMSAWNPAEFDHNLTSFPLVGAHVEVDCQSCHATGYTGTLTDCFSCHETSFAEAEDPDHVAGGFDHDCTGCHSMNAWSPATFDHSQTSFALTGAHEAVQCQSCHSEGYTSISTDCYSCHATAFTEADPDHVANNFEHDCTTCHNTNAWSPAIFDHNRTEFALTGAHTSLLCQSCHSEGFTGTSSECYSCHVSAFQSAIEPNHMANNFDHDCMQCHNTTAWSPSTFDHELTQFPLTGAHTTLQCQSCHSEGYTNTATDCFSCHATAFQEADPDHVANNFDHDCTSCHTTSAWEPATFDHNLTDFPLTGAHTPLQCQSCHSQGFTGTSMECYSCHVTAYESVEDPNHVTNNLDHDCTQCHTTNAWEPSTFDHNLTEFPLTGAHMPLQCQSCHSEGYAGTTTDCYSCHATAYQGADPDHVANNFDHDCTQCHTTNAWEPANFDHNLTEFPLTGAHTGLQCLTCHSQGFTGTSMECYSCHITAYEGATDPNHAANNFDHDCSQCHSTSAWEPSTFSHDQTGFTLTGAHTSLQCLACHSEGYAGTINTCYGCHDGDYAGVVEPNHAANNFDQDCTQCHSTSSWSPSTFDHSATGFALTGAHTTLQCIACHSQGYVSTPNDCYSCHNSLYDNSTDPDHAEAGFSVDCSGCHSTNTWLPSSWDHSTTGFAITGAHLGKDCQSCHATGYTNADPACYSCHQEDFTRTSDPDHVANNFDHDCTQCHNTNAWDPSTFDHSLTSFVLTGAHAVAQCLDCHSTGYTATDPACYSCHSDNFASTTDPEHESNGFDHDCTRCHNTTAWQPSDFDHSTTQFPLTGAHASANCISCHAAGYTLLPTDCFSCHNTDFAGVTDPDHATNNFDHDCTQCHNTNAWSPATFDHNQTAFPITGAHVGLPCLACHSSGYAGTATFCYACHQGDFESVTDPNHAANNFSFDCTDCHNTNGWSPSTFDHSQTGFALTGGHMILQCLDCHSGGYAGTSSQCYACHQSDYEGTSDPNHASANFPTTCENCHNTTSWNDADWDHDSQFFPIYSGKHQGEWNDCADCHVTPTDFSAFECILCHEHRQSSMDDKHSDINNYEYNSNACYNCHPRGRS